MRICGTFLLLTASCSSPTRVCDQVAACESPATAAHEACLSNLASDLDRSELVGCEEEYELYLDCQLDFGECIEGTFRVDTGACLAASNGWLQCLTRNSGITG